jgi:hypothetical protein
MARSPEINMTTNRMMSSSVIGIERAHELRRFRRSTPRPTHDLHLRDESGAAIAAP